MRILKIFFFGLIWFVIGGLAVGFMTREILLYIATSQFRTVAKKAYSIQTPPNFTTNCLEYGGVPIDGQAITQMQVRFVSDKKFVLEIVCRSTESVRQVLADYSLPWLVRKEPGQSGLVKGQDGTAIVLSIFNRKGLVYQEDGFVFSDISLDRVDELDLSSGPATTCQGYGYGCCDQLFQIGDGEQQPAATDCPKSCFPQCLNRPVVLNFKAATLSLGNFGNNAIKTGEEVKFYFSISDTSGDVFADESLFNEVQLELGPEDGGSSSFEEKILTILDKYANRANTEKKENIVKEVVLDFGDGEQKIVSDLQGEVEHIYTCSKSSCQYTATLVAKTTLGIENVTNALSTIRVNVRR